MESAAGDESAGHGEHWRKIGNHHFVDAAGRTSQPRATEALMSGTLINLIVQLIAGAIGGNAAGNALKDYDLGTLGNTMSGGIGGGWSGTGVSTVGPRLAGGGGGVDGGAVRGQAVGRGAAGAFGWGLGGV